MSPPHPQQAREAQAWAQPFIDRWALAMVRFAAAYTGDAETAQDVVQETFLRLLLWHDRHPSREVQPGWRRDIDAVHHGIVLEWSQGPVEGSINRLKLIKRTMYGRGGHDLLRRRVTFHLPD